MRGARKGVRHNYSYISSVSDRIGGVLIPGNQMQVIVFIAERNFAPGVYILYVHLHDFAFLNECEVMRDKLLIMPIIYSYVFQPVTWASRNVLLHLPDAPDLLSLIFEYHSLARSAHQAPTISVFAHC